MVIFGLFVNFFLSFLLVARVVGFFFVSRRSSWFLDLDDVVDDDDLDEDPARISPDAQALSPDLTGLPDLVSPFSRSRRISGSGWPFLQISLDRRISLALSPDVAGSRRKEKKNLKKKRVDIDLFFSCN